MMAPKVVHTKSSKIVITASLRFEEKHVACRHRRGVADRHGAAIRRSRSGVASKMHAVTGMKTREPMNRVATCVDFSDASFVALEHAVAIARRENAEIVLAHANPAPRAARVDDEGSPRTNLDEWLLSQVSAGTRALAALAEKTHRSGLRVTHVSIDDDAVPGLAFATNELECELVVVGSRGHTGLKRYLLGSVAERTIRLVERCAMVARGPAPSAGYRRVLVATDFSQTAERALDFGVRLAGDGAEVALFHCAMHPSMVAAVSPEHAISFPMAEAMEELEQRALTQGKELRRRYSDTRVAVDFELSRSVAPAGVLERLDQDGDAFDLVVLGTHGRQGWRRFFLGSVAETTARHAPCSVLVVHSEGDYGSLRDTD
jgi:nucleotide-binding universal stress UspA family protein